MPLLNRLKPKRSKPTGRLAIAYWDKENLFYAVVQWKSNKPSVLESGSVAHGDQPNPLAALSQHLAEKQMATQNLMVLLSRSDVDVLQLDLPPAEKSELPGLVAAEVEQQLGESETPPVVDFYVPAQLERVDEPQSEGELQEVFTFALSHARLEAIQGESQQAGFRLVSASFRQLVALSLLPSQDASAHSSLTVSVQLYPGEIELALCAGSRPLLLRSVRVNSEDWDRTAEQLLVEVQRCMTLVPPQFEERDPQWFVDVSSDAARQLASALRERSRSTVREVESKLETDDVLPSSLVGAARAAANDALEIDFVHPRRSPPPPNKWVRPAAWGAISVAAATIVGWTLMSDVWRLQEEAAKLSVELADSKKLGAKLQEKSDQVQLVERWLSDQVDWLSALNEISQRLPEGSNATVRRLSASTDGLQGVFDLSVQVSHPDDISVLESRLRSVKYSVSSKRISQTPDASEYPWKFETRVTFPIEPLDWRSFELQ